MVNRIWQHHFGRGIVETPSNFRQHGARPPTRSCWTIWRRALWRTDGPIKQMHREIMLSAVYALSSEDIPANGAVDPDDRLLWRANWQRMDAETLRDSLLFVSGNLDPQAGGPPPPLDDKNKRRAVYGFVSRRKLDSMMALFDFPNPNSTSEQRVVTNVPLQRPLHDEQQLRGRAGGRTRQAAEREMRRACSRPTGPVYGREPSAEELQPRPGVREEK